MEPLWVNKDKLLSAYVLCYLDALINPHGVVNNPHGNQTHTHTHTTGNKGESEHTRWEQEQDSLMPRAVSLSPFFPASLG